MPKNVVCKKCNNLVNDWCEKVIDSPDRDMQRDCQYFCEKTNADRIRAMSDEDLAELIVKHNPMHAWNKQVRKIYFGFEDHRKDNPQRAWLEWLQQPAETQKEETG